MGLANKNREKEKERNENILCGMYVRSIEERYARKKSVTFFEANENNENDREATTKCRQ